MNELTTIKTDICVIGAGSGGLSVASGAVQMGAKVVLIEGGEMGGDCLNSGCVPSKALVAAGKAAQHTRDGGPGVAGVAPQVDYAAAKDHVAQAIATIAPHDSQERFESLGCQVLRDHARFISPTEVQAGHTVVKARRFVIATGSAPMVPPIPGIEDVDVHTNETIFDLRDRPDHLLIIGAGPIGLEMAQAHVRLGCRVTVIEAATPLAHDDPELVEIVVDRLKAEGVTFLTGAKASRIEAKDGITVHTDAGAVSGSHLLMAVGRRINIGDLGLDAGNVDHTPQGVTVNGGLRSVSNRKVYAVGDAAGGMQFTHVAGYHAGVIIRPMLFGLPAKARTDHIPWVTYTDPELAHVGLTEAQARETHGDKLTVLRQPFSGNDRAITEGRTTGLVKLMVVGGKPVGASVVGHDAGALIATWAQMIANGDKLTALTSTVLPYPTLAEINKRVAGAYYSPKLFENTLVKRVVGLVQKLIP